MVDSVLRAMAKLPNVPAVFGWLALDRRGKWLIKGDRISNPVVADFISRNYRHDDTGRWFFENGPQRVFAALEYTPFVYHVAGNADPGAFPWLATHTGKHVTAVSGAWLDEAGILLLATGHGVGMVDDRDLERLLPCLAGPRGRPLDEDALGVAVERLQEGLDAKLQFRYGEQAVPVAAIASRDVPGKFGFVQRPEPPPEREECR